MPASGGAESPVLAEFPHELWSNWAVLNDGVYYTKRHEPGRATIEFYDLASRSASDIMLVDSFR